MGNTLCTVVRMEWIKVKVQRINGAQRSALRLEEGCLPRGCGMNLEKEAGHIIAVIWKIH